MADGDEATPGTPESRSCSLRVTLPVSLKMDPLSVTTSESSVVPDSDEVDPPLLAVSESITSCEGDRLDRTNSPHPVAPSAADAIARVPITFLHSALTFMTPTA